MSTQTNYEPLPAFSLLDHTNPRESATTMTTDERDKIREETGIPGNRYDGREKLPVSDCGDPLQDIINDINTRMEHDSESWGNA